MYCYILKNKTKVLWLIMIVMTSPCSPFPKSNRQELLVLVWPACTCPSGIIHNDPFTLKSDLVWMINCHLFPRDSLAAGVSACTCYLVTPLDNFLSAQHRFQPYCFHQASSGRASYVPSLQLTLAQ